MPPNASERLHGGPKRPRHSSSLGARAGKRRGDGGPQCHKGPRGVVDRPGSGDSQQFLPCGFRRRLDDPVIRLARMGSHRRGGGTTGTSRRAGDGQTRTDRPTAHRPHPARPLRGRQPDQRPGVRTAHRHRASRPIAARRDAAPMIAHTADSKNPARPIGLAGFLMVGVARIELATPAMSTQCSTTELHAHVRKAPLPGSAGERKRYSARLPISRHPPGTARVKSARHCPR